MLDRYVKAQRGGKLRQRKRAVLETENIIRNAIIAKEGDLYVHSYMSKKEYRTKHFNFYTNWQWNTFQKLARERLFEHSCIFFDRVLTKCEQDLLIKRETAIFEKSVELAEPELGKDANDALPNPKGLVSMELLNKVFKAEPDLQFPYRFEQVMIDNMTEEEQEEYSTFKFEQIVDINGDKTCALCL